MSRARSRRTRLVDESAEQFERVKASG